MRSSTTGYRACIGISVAALGLLSGCVHRAATYDGNAVFCEWAIEQTPSRADDPLDIELVPVARHQAADGVLRVGSARSRVEMHSGTGIRFKARNATHRLITIEWDRSALVEEDGRSRRVTHSGVRPEAAGYPQAPTAVPPDTVVEERIYPADAIRPGHSEWRYERFLPTSTTPATYKLRLVIAVSLDGAPSFQTVMFQARDACRDNTDELRERLNQ